MRSYGGDVSRLTDVCRQSLVFKDLAGVASCLRSIAQDPEVAVLRVKNRLDPSYDARTSAGYRLLLSDLKNRTTKTIAYF